jgi:hypothetical protein
MLSESSNKVAIRNELLSIHHSLAEKFSYLESIPWALKLIENMLTDLHPSGFPEPENLRWTAGYLRREKFKAIQEKGASSALASDIQVLITRLKRLYQQAELARPAPSISVTRENWWNREWEYLSYTIPVFPVLYAILIFIAGIIIFFSDMNCHAGPLILGGVISICIFVSILLKDVGSLHMLLTMAACVLFAYRSV